MLREFKEKEFNRINGMIDSYNEDIAKLSKQTAAVDEKYRKLAEEEKKNLTEVIDYYNKLVVELATRRDSLGLDAVKPDKKTQKKKIEEAIEKEEVVDTLFPENNTVVEEVTSSVEEPVIEMESAPEEQMTEVEDVWETSSSDEESDEEVWASENEDEKYLPEQDPTLVNLTFSDDQEQAETPAEETEAEENGDDDDEWPDVVEEWK